MSAAVQAHMKVVELYKILGADAQGTYCIDSSCRRLAVRFLNATTVAVKQWSQSSSVKCNGRLRMVWIEDPYLSIITLIEECMELVDRWIDEHDNVVIVINIIITHHSLIHSLITHSLITHSLITHHHSLIITSSPTHHNITHSSSLITTHHHSSLPIDGGTASQQVTHDDLLHHWYPALGDFYLAARTPTSKQKVVIYYYLDDWLVDR